MRLVFDREGTRHEVRVAQTSEHATLADLIGAATGSPVPTDEMWWVDQTQHAADASIGEVVLLEGSLIARSRPDAAEPLRGWCVLLGGGLHAGDAVRLPKSRPLIIGRSPQADVHVDSPKSFLEPRHASSARVTAYGSRTPVPPTAPTSTASRSLMSAGRHHGLRPEHRWQCCHVDPGDPGVAGTAARDVAQPDSGQDGSLQPAPPAGSRGGPGGHPSARAGDPPPSRFSIATIVGPLVLAGVMVVIYGPQFALFSLISPVLAVGT